MTLRSRTDRFRPIVLAAGLALTVSVSSAGAVTTISSSAYGLGTALTVTGLATVSVGPLSPAGGSAPGPYNASNTLASATAALGLGSSLGVNYGLGLGTGLITSIASSPFLPTATGTARATVNGLSSGLNGNIAGIALPSLLTIGATTVTSTSSVNGIGALSATGSSSIENLTIGGSALGGVTFNLAGIINPAPNTVLFDLGGLEITLNEQTPSGDGITSDGMSTNAIVVEFTNFLLGTNLLNGNLIVAHSDAFIRGVAAPAPEPAAWMQMLSGFGLVGVAIRRRRPSGSTSTGLIK